MKPSCVLIVDDHAVVRAGLRRLIESEEDLEVVGEAATGTEAVELARALRPDVVVMDLVMPDLDGVEATRAITQASETRVLVLSMHGERSFVDRVLEAGAAGYVLKVAADTELVGAIRAVCQGESYIDPALAKPIMSAYLRERQAGESRRLSRREEEVLCLTAWGYTAREIGERLGVSGKTVESHKARLMEKLDLRSRAELVRHAKVQGLLDKEPD